MEFNWDMDEESTRAAFSITPEVEGTLTFEDSQYSLRFTPSFPLEKATVYTVKLDKSAKHPDNLSMEQDFVFQFTTKSRNRLALIGGYPNSGNTGIYAAKPLFWYFFDKKLNSSNIRDNISVYDADGNEISKATRSIKINKAGNGYGDIYFELGEPLQAGNSYKVKMAGNAMDETGVKLVEPIEINFAASNVIVANKTVVEDFEIAGKYVYDETQSENITSATIARSTAEKLFESAAYKLNAAFSDADAFAVYRINEPSITTETSKVFGLHVYGICRGTNCSYSFDPKHRK
jgi:hypothetical protein